MTEAECARRAAPILARILARTGDPKPAQPAPARSSS